jgi:hypothetical protein
MSKKEVTQEAALSAQKEKSGKTYTLSPEGKQSIMAILATKPFNAVLGIVNFLEKPEYAEEEANYIINFIGAYPYAEVVGFFQNVKEYFIESSQD